MRPVFFALLLLSSFQSNAWASSDPFDTLSLVPPKPMLHAQSAIDDPCPEAMPDVALDLLDVVNLALCNNPQTREVWANSRVYAAQIGVNKAEYLPSANLNASGSRSKTDSNPSVDQSRIGLTFSYLLYDFGLRAANLEGATQMLVAASATQDSTVQAIFFAAVQAYYQEQAAIAALDAALESERAAKESFAAAEARYIAGSATPADKLQAQTAFSQATLNRITVAGNLRNAQGSLANMIGMDANQKISLVPANTAAMPDEFEGDVDALIKEARQRRPDLQSAAAQVKAAQASIEAARAAGSPTISLAASADKYKFSGSSSRGSSIGINLNVPIFSGFAPTYRIRAAEAQLDTRSAQYDKLRLQVALDVWTAYQELTTATQSLRTTADLLDSADLSARVALGRYKAGVGSMLDVLNAQSTLASARQQRIQSTLNWNINRAGLAQAVGSLDAGLLQTLSDLSNQAIEDKSPKKNQP